MSPFLFVSRASGMYTDVRDARDSSNPCRLWQRVYCASASFHLPSISNASARFSRASASFSSAPIFSSRRTLRSKYCAAVWKLPRPNSMMPMLLYAVMRFQRSPCCSDSSRLTL